MIKHAIRELKDELQIWHLLVALVLIGVTATWVMRGGTAGSVTTCHEQAEEATKEQVVQQLETLPLTGSTSLTGDGAENESRYMRAYRRCLQELGVQ